MKNLIYLVSTLVFVLLCLTSCQKEELTDFEQTSAKRTVRAMTAAGSGGVIAMGPNVIISGYETGANYDCCEASKYTMDGLTHSHFINSENKKYKVTFTVNGTSNTIYTSSQVFYRHWSSDGEHNVFVQIVNQDGSPVGAESDVYTFAHVDTPPCTPC